MNIYQRLNEIRKAVSYIQKDAKVQGYRAVTHDMVTSELRPELIKHGVIVVPKQTSSKIEDTGKSTSNGTPFTRYVATYDIEFVNMDDPADKVVVSVGALAEDQGDKGAGKCISYATKMAFLKLFSIETGESDESRQESKPSPITEMQLITLREICESGDLPIDKTLHAMATKAFGLKKIEELPSQRFDEAAIMLNKKIQQTRAG